MSALGKYTRRHVFGHKHNGAAVYDVFEVHTDADCAPDEDGRLHSVEVVFYPPPRVRTKEGE